MNAPQDEPFIDKDETKEHQEHECLLTFSIQGLIFLSGEWIRKSPFSLSSMNAFILGCIQMRESKQQ